MSSAVKAENKKSKIKKFFKECIEIYFILCSLGLTVIIYAFFEMSATAERGYSGVFGSEEILILPTFYAVYKFLMYIWREVRVNG